MSIRIKYAYLHGQVWMYRRNYPEDVALVLGSKALKRSLKTSDPKMAKTRSLEINGTYEEQVIKARGGISTMTAPPQSGPPAQGLGENWDGVNKQTVARLRAALEPSGLRRFSGTKRTSAKVGILPKSTLGSGPWRCVLGTTNQAGIPSGRSIASTPTFQCPSEAVTRDGPFLKPSHCCQR
jgi:hypothetical protein